MEYNSMPYADGGVRMPDFAGGGGKGIEVFPPGIMDPPSAPMMEPPNTVNFPPNPRMFEMDPPSAPKYTPKRSSRHMLYAVEILVFAVVGWGWLAVREYMGATPVLDVSVLLCLLITSLVNLALALMYPTVDQFKAPAQGLLAHAVSVWVLYAYGLLESTTSRPGNLCCHGASTFSVPQTYAAAYFGGLTLHQTAGAVTLAFLTVYLLLTAVQVRVCMDDPREWLLSKTALSTACLMSFHLGLFALNAGACGGDLGIGVLVVASIGWILLTDIKWVLSSLYGQNTNSDALYSVIQSISELTITVLLTAVAGVLSSSLGGAPSAVLMVVLAGAMLWQSAVVALSLVACKGVKKQRKVSPAPPDPQPLLAGFRMVLPGRGARIGERKAW